MNKANKFTETHHGLMAKVDENLVQIKIGLNKIRKILNRK